MKMKSRILAAFLAILTVVQVASATSNESTGDAWEKAIFVYGSGLNNEEISKTENILGVENNDQVQKTMVDGQDELRYLKNATGIDADMISSVLVKKENPGTGVNLTIKTPDNITQITSDQYINAAITAGVKDCTITVGSVRPVTGESALVGIYKAFEEAGESLDQDRMEVAQKELTVTNDIAQENKDKEDFTVDKLNQVIIDVKAQINNYYSQEEHKADAEEIQKFIEDSIEKYDLQDIVTSDQVKRLTELFNEYQETGAVNSDEVIKELSILADDIKDKAGQIYEDAKEAGILDKIADFFSMIFAAIKDSLAN